MKTGYSAIALALLAGLASPAFADEAYVWPLCADLGPMIEAAQAPDPFVEFSERTKNGDSFGVVPGYASLDMSKTSKCQVYVAGTREGIRGGGQYNSLKCTVFRASGEAIIGRGDLIAKRQYYAGILGTCNELSEWRFALPENANYRTTEEGWTDPVSGAQIVTEVVEDSGICKRKGCTPRPSQEVHFIVRAPNPSYTPPAPLP